MLFVEPSFLFVFLPLSLAAFYGLARVFGVIGGYLVLSFASIVFYLPHGAFATALLLASLAVNLALGLLLSRPQPLSDRARLAAFVAGLAYDFGMLAVFKYANAVALLVADADHRLVGVDIPSGISFYTFHQAVFLFDCWSRRPETARFLRPDRSDGAGGVLGYATFILLFPQLVIGPISYLRDMAPQLAGGRFGRARRLDFEVGLMLLAVGLFKKIIVADGLAKFVDPAFAALAEGRTLPRDVAAAATLGFYAQLYFDFSGYSDAALGLARWFGLRLPQNFDSPLRATGIVDFYRRWHMTLTRVIAAFLFTPISVWGTRLAARRRLGRWPAQALSSWLPLIVNFQAIALWHGATATFFVFGLVHGLWFVLETEIRTTRWWRERRRRTSDRRRRVAGQLATVVPLMLTFTLFRCDSLGSFGRLLASLVQGAGETGADLSPRGDQWLLLAAAFAIVWILPNIYHIMARYRPSIPTYRNENTALLPRPPVWRPTAVWGLIAAALIVAVLTRLNDPTPFLYGGF